MVADAFWKSDLSVAGIFNVTKPLETDTAFLAAAFLTLARSSRSIPCIRTDEPRVAVVDNGHSATRSSKGSGADWPVNFLIRFRSIGAI